MESGYRPDGPLAPSAPGSASCLPRRRRWRRCGSSSGSWSRCCCSSSPRGRHRLVGAGQLVHPPRPVAARWAGILTLLIFFGSIILLAALGHPDAGRADGACSATGCPHLIGQIDEQIAALLARYPDLQPYSARKDRASATSCRARASSSRASAASRCRCSAWRRWRSSSSAPSLYIVLDPCPLLNAYLGSLPRAYLPAGMRAYRRAAHSVIGWTKASLVDRRDPGGGGVHLPHP